MNQASGKADTEQESKARQTAKTALQKRFERMVENKPIREGKPVAREGLRRAMRSDLRTVVHRTKLRVQADARRAEERAKAEEAGLTIDDLIEIGPQTI